MPAFTRTVWVSDQSRDVWERRFVGIAGCWKEIEWRTVMNQVRDCSLMWASSDEISGLESRLANHGLKILPLFARARRRFVKPGIIKSSHNSLQPLFRIVAGRAKHLGGFRKAWVRGDDDVVGQYLGYPSCCRVFFRKFFVQEKWMDCILPAALNTETPPGNIQDVDVVGNPLLNPFWISVGVRLSPLFPCHFDCKHAGALAKYFAQAGEEAGFGAEIKFALEILNWPVEWSALHGIAEIKTPILKIAKRTDMTPLKYRIRWLGKSFPSEGGRGLDFPYRIGR